MPEDVLVVVIEVEDVSEVSGTRLVGVDVEDVEESSNLTYGC